MAWESALTTLSCLTGPPSELPAAAILINRPGGTATIPEAPVAVRVIASIEDPGEIEKILAHLGETHAPRPSLIALRPAPRAPPGSEG